MKQLADGLGHTRAIEDAGGRVVADTCMVVSPMEAMGFSVSGVSSGKAANYLPGFCSQEVVFGDVDALIEEALS
jgi:predicted aconitase